MNLRAYVHCPSLVSSRKCIDNISQRLRTLQGVHVTVCCDLGNEWIEEALPGAEVRRIPNLTQEFEYSTLDQIWQDSQHEDFYCLYLHAKGSTKEGPALQNSIDWQNYMLHGLVENAGECVKHLDQGADLVGSMWYWHFKGNFWWASSRHLRSMPKPLGLSSNRFDAEYWCCLGLWWLGQGIPKPKVKNMFYLPGLQSDDGFSEMTALVPIGQLHVPQGLVFIDKSLPEKDGRDRSCQDIFEFLQSGYKCAFYEVHIPLSSLSAVNQLKDFLEYDGKVCVHRPDGSVGEMGSSALS